MKVITFVGLLFLLVLTAYADCSRHVIAVSNCATLIKNRTAKEKATLHSATFEIGIAAYSATPEKIQCLYSFEKTIEDLRTAKIFGQMTLDTKTCRLLSESNSSSTYKGFHLNPVCGEFVRGIQNKIQECSFLESSFKENFQLVMRKESPHYDGKNYFKQEFYLDTNTKLIWGPKFPIGARKDFVQGFCARYSEIIDLSWRLPSKEEWEVASLHKIAESLPDMDGWFWSSTEAINDKSQSWVYYAGNGVTSPSPNESEGVSFRCVSELKDK